MAALPVLLDEAPLALSIAYLFGGQYFESDEAVQARVASLPHYTHPAFAQFLEDLIMADRAQGAALRRLFYTMIGCLSGC